MIEQLRFPVIAISPSGVDVYATQRELTTCHRRAVKSTYIGLKLVDMDRDKVDVIRHRVHSLPPRVVEGGRLNADFVNVELVLSEIERLAMPEVRAMVLEGLKAAFGEEFDPESEQVKEVNDAKGMRELHLALSGDFA